MPPTDPIDPPVGDIAPYPMDILTLGGNRWLDPTGRILTTEFGNPVELQPNTLKFWEATALRGTGKPLSELLVVDELDMLEWLQFETEERLAADPDNKQAGWELEDIKKRIDALKTRLVIELGRGGLDPEE
jgi:hypothetical protein